MKKNKIYFDVHFLGYPKDKVYSLAHDFGRNLCEYLGIKSLSLFLDSDCLIIPEEAFKQPWYIQDSTYKLHSASKALEFFLKKLIKGQDLRENSGDEIGHVFGDRNQKVKNKIKQRKLIAKTKAVWDYTRNDIMHYSDIKMKDNCFNQFNELKDLIRDLYKDFYGKSEPDEEIEKGWQENVISKFV